MSIRLPDDTILPPTGRTDKQSARLKPAVFIPIAIALFGVAAVLFGGVTAHGPSVSTVSAGQVDPITTGSVPPMSEADHRRALEMLDR